MRRDLHLTPCRPRFGNKAASIERAVARVREEYGGDDANLFASQTRQDAIILNLQRACESSIDAAMHLVRVRRLGVPQESREAFDLLERANVRGCVRNSVCEAGLTSRF